MKAITKNERVKELVRTVIMDDDYEELQQASKGIEYLLSNDEKYQQLVAAVEKYRLSVYAQNEEYQQSSRSTLFTAFRAASKMLPFIKIPADYLEDDKTRFDIAKSGIYNTDARIASLILKINAKFTVKRIRITEERIHLTEEEKARLYELVDAGVIDKDRADAQIRAGKKVRR